MANVKSFVIINLLVFVVGTLFLAHSPKYYDPFADSTLNDENTNLNNIYYKDNTTFYNDLGYQTSGQTLLGQENSSSLFRENAGDDATTQSLLERVGAVVGLTDSFSHWGTGLLAVGKIMGIMLSGGFWFVAVMIPEVCSNGCNEGINMMLWIIGLIWIAYTLFIYAQLLFRRFAQ